ncbi:MAG TPA: hypothetical protein VGM10_32440 [Actinocrinis sp.]|jgi:hypothetical protein
MRKLLLIPAAAAVAVLTAFAAVPASADTTDVLTAGGNNVVAGSPGDTVTGSSTSAVLSTSAGSITCTQAAFTSNVQSNPAAPGTATEQVTSLSATASTCKSTIAGTTSVQSVGLTSGNTPIASVDDSSLTLTITPSVTVVLGTVLGRVTCIYSGTLVAQVVNSSNAIVFSDATVTRQTGSSTVCPTTGGYTATYSPVEDTSMTGDPAVTVN